MKKILIVIVLVVIYLAITKKPSAESIAREMLVSDAGISYQGGLFSSDWGEVETVTGYLQRIDREYYDYAPIITYHLVVTTEDYNDSELINLKHQGNGHYTYRYPTDRPFTGSLVVYHAIPADVSLQLDLENLKPSQDIEMELRLSKSSALKKDSVDVFKVNGTNHKIALVSIIK